MARKIYKFLEENIGVKTERIVIHFNDIQAKDVGYGGTTAKEYLSGFYNSDKFFEE